MDEILEVYKTLKNIKYGWVDKNNEIHEKLAPKLFRENYILQTPSDLEKNKIGVCFDQVEYEREKLKDFKSYFIIYDDGKKFPCHTFGVVHNKKFYWLENAWSFKQGIHEYNTLEELFTNVIKVFPKINNLEKIDLKKLFIYEYKKPKPHITCDEFFEYCQKSKQVFKG